ncbi:hypothetical protein [Actinoplanes rectilineatus]|uniref:hypothetical protein n=1 Tax=Actinoplanes rectilineatus TaxID=113571 RepID=UPI0005F2C3DF|nr:hypothetical protein [Actinoplanes rectilineatus]
MAEATIPPFPTCTITTIQGPVTVPCEPIGEHLAIAPAFGMTEDFRAFLSGNFVITHRATGLHVSDGPGCIECCRSAGKALLATEVDWASITAEGSAEFWGSLTDEIRLAVAEARTVNWSCDAEYCNPWPEGVTAERAESRSNHLKRLVEQNARIVAAEEAAR